MKKNNYQSGQFMIQLAIGLYFSITGLLGIIGYNSGSNQLFNGVNKILGNNIYIPLAISILMMIFGLFLIVSLFMPTKNKVLHVIILILWVLYMVYTYFTNGFMKPELLGWLQKVSKDLVILAGLWNCSIRG